MAVLNVASGPSGQLVTFYNAGEEGRGMRVDVRISLADLGLLTLQTCAPGARTRIAAGRHPARRFSVNAQTRQLTLTESGERQAVSFCAHGRH
jgi:hypothetical protein